MPGAKTATLTFRMDPDLKEALRLAAERERRSITNMIEVSDPESLQRKRHPYRADGCYGWQGRRAKMIKNRKASVPFQSDHPRLPNGPGH